MDVQTVAPCSEALSEGRVVRVDVLQRPAEERQLAGDEGAWQARSLLALFRTSLRIYEENWGRLLWEEDRRHTLG